MYRFIFILFSTACFGQTYFNLANEFPQVNFNPNPDFSNIKPLSQSESNIVFNQIENNSKIQFNYPQGGCPERAIITNYILDSLKVDNFKIWLFAPSRLIKNSKEQIYIYDKNSLTTDAENKIKWDFHVAPAILSENSNGTIDTLIIDPSVAKKPLKTQEWLGHIEGAEKAKYSYTKGKFYNFFQQDNGRSNVINGSFFEYVSTSYNGLWLEKMLALNDVAFEMYKEYILNDDVDLSTKADVKVVIGNSATLKDVLDFKSGAPAKSSIRYLINNQNEFIIKSWDLYQRQILIWADRIENLKLQN
ncbi:protein-glutamine glutaminase family protein [Tenacibaculum maritimum]|uniref:protein-glutamine glutaminase family protein n=1 Tax=Tenacibaculum maritimum TaxID=107401 RepID=UPI00388D7D48